MKITTNNIVSVIISVMISSCATTDDGNNEIKRCPKNTPETPVNFILVVLDKEERGLPIGVVIPPSNSDFVDFKHSKRPFTSILKNDHPAHQTELVCWQAVVKESKNGSGYKPTKQKIAVLWSPFQKITFKRIVQQVIPEKGPVDIVYKYTIASEASNPKKGNTYLDPRMVVRIKR